MGLCVAAVLTALSLGAQPGGALEAGAPALGPDPALGFELLPPADIEVSARDLRLQSEVDLRRSLLQWHQGLGLATAALVLGTLVTGQLNYSDRFAGQSSGQFEAWHTTFEAAATLSFAADGILALVAPVPYPKRNSGDDSLLIHKISMIVATAGFASEIPLGIYTVAREGHLNQPTFALVHLILGYVTGAAVATGVGALAF